MGPIVRGCPTMQIEGGQSICPAPLPTVPRDYPQHLRALRCQLRLTHSGLARRIGAAGKAVIYQWESRKRTPSPVLWQRVEALTANQARRTARSQIVEVPAHHANRLPHGGDTQPSADRYTLRDCSLVEALRS